MIRTLQYLLRSEKAFKKQTEREAFYTGNGVDAKWCRTNIDRVRFQPTEIGGLLVGVRTQKVFIKDIVTAPIHQIMAITSQPTDEQALAVAYWIAMRTHETRRRISFAAIDAAEPKRLVGVRNGRYYPRIVIIHNIMNDATEERCETVRSIMKKYYLSIRLVVLCAVPDPYTFTAQKIGITPNYVANVAAKQGR